MAEFSWSFSRGKMFYGCEREYALHYYGTQVLQDADRNVVRQLKHLTTYAMVFGATIHECANALAKAHAGGFAAPSLDELEARVRRRLNDLHRSSKDLSGYVRQPKPDTMLKEVFYGEEVSAGIAKTRDKVRPALVALYNCAIWEEVRRLGPSRVRIFDGVPSIVHARFGRIYAAPDLLLLDDDAMRISIIDWKTGSSRGVHGQIGCYGWFVPQLLRISPAACDFVARVITLSPFNDREMELTPEHVLIAERKIENSVADMHSKLADVKRNVPLPLARFPLRSEENARRCMNCRFFQLCEKELARECAA